MVSRLTFVLSVVATAAIVAIGMSSRVPEAFARDGEEIVVRDSKGVVRISLSVRDEAARIELRDAKGNVRWSSVVSDDGMSGTNHWSPDSKMSYRTIMGNEGYGERGVHETVGPLMTMLITPTRSNLQLQSGDSPKVRLYALSESAGMGTVVKDTPLSSFAARVDGTCAITFADADGRPRLRVGSGTDVFPGYGLWLGGRDSPGISLIQNVERDAVQLALFDADEKGVRGATLLNYDAKTGPTLGLHDRTGKLRAGIQVDGESGRPSVRLIGTESGDITIPESAK